MDSFFRQHVSNTGVDYAAIKRDPFALDELVIAIATTDPSTWSPPERKAWWVNAYNLLVIDALVQRYPVASPMDIPGFFKVTKRTVGGQEITLDALERERLFRDFPDPRLHFVLCCGARGCPPLAAFAYTADQLDEQLDARVRLAVNDVRWVRVDEAGGTAVSELMQWYEKDFEAQGGVRAFLDRYRDKAMPPATAITYLPYDWSLNGTISGAPTATEPSSDLNLQTFTPSVLMDKGQWEFKLFNNLYTQTKGFNAEGARVDFGSRSTFNTMLVQFMTGYTPRVSLGVDLWIRSVHLSGSESSPADVFLAERSNTSRTSLSLVGPKVKLALFPKVPKLSVQSSFLVPVAKDQEGLENGGPFLANDSYLWITQVFYDYAITRRLQLFAQISPWYQYRIAPNSDGRSRHNLSTPVTGFLTWFASDRLSFSILQEYWPTWGDSGVSSWFRQEGLGTKFQLIPGLLEVEATKTWFTAGRNTGAGQTFNLGIRILH